VPESTMNERGVTLLESLLALAMGSIVLLGVGSLYSAMLRSGQQDNVQISLQRQGTFVTEEMARQIRTATVLNQATGLCRNVNSNSLKVTQQVTTGLVNFCFYASQVCSRTITPCTSNPDCPVGETCSLSQQILEDRPGGVTENLLVGSVVPLAVPTSPP